MKVKQGLLKFISSDVAVETRRGVAVALASGTSEDAIAGLEALSPADSITTLYILSFDSDSRTSTEASTGLTSFNAEKLKLALAEKLDPVLLARLVALFPAPSVLALISENKGADERVKKLVLKKCKAQELSAKRAPKPVKQSPVEQVEKEEQKEEEEGSIYQRVQNMNTAEKIKLGQTGDKAERGLLINDPNKVVCSAVLKNPRITDGEITMVANSKSASDEVLRIIARNKDWLKNMHVKLGLIKNPKTPLPIAMRLLDYIDKRELAKLAKSKNISSILSSNALRKMQRIR